MPDCSTSRPRKIHWLTQDKWEVSGESFSPDGKYLTYTANVDGNTDIYLHEIATGKARALPLPKGLNQPAGGTSPFTRDSSRLLYYHNGPTAPGDLWVYNLADGKSQQLTHSLVGGVRSLDMVEPSLVHYPSKDGKWTISAFVYMPYNLPRNGQHPAIVFVHGGPTAQTLNTFNRFVQYVANQGYIVIAPNYRGSTGYGKEFQQANLFDMGGGDLAGRAGRRRLDQTDRIRGPQEADPDGRQLWRLHDHDGRDQGSRAYGPPGFPSCPSSTGLPRFRTKIPSCAKAIWPPWAIRRKTRRATKTARRSTLWTGSRRRLYLLAGGNDPRCPKTEAQQVVDAIKKRGGVVEYKVYENEGHGFARVENQIDAYKRVADFLKAHVPPADCSCSLNE